MRKGIEHGPGAARVGTDGRRDTFLLRAPEERRGDFARQRFEDRASPRRQGVLALLADVDEPSPSLRETGDGTEGDSQHDEPTGAAQHYRAYRGRRPARGDETAGERKREHQHESEVRKRARSHPAARQLLDPAAGTERCHRVHTPGRQPVVDVTGNPLGAGHDQREQSARTGHECGRRIHGRRGCTEGDGIEGRQQRERSEPRTGRRAEIRLPEIMDSGGKHRGQQQHQGEHHQPGEKLPRDQRSVRDR